jgi:hypothetical protein
MNIAAYGTDNRRLFLEIITQTIFSLPQKCQALLNDIRRQTFEQCNEM